MRATITFSNGAVPAITLPRLDRLGSGWRSAKVGQQFQRPRRSDTDTGLAVVGVILSAAQLALTILQIFKDHDRGGSRNDLPSACIKASTGKQIEVSVTDSEDEITQKIERLSQDDATDEG